MCPVQKRRDFPAAGHAGTLPAVRIAIANGRFITVNAWHKETMGEKDVKKP
jgi:hypothetical protein